MENRQMRRKNKIKNEKKSDLKQDYEDTKSTIKVIIVVVVCLIIFYIITLVATKNMKLRDNKDDNATPVVIQYNEILAGEALNMADDNYYVMFFDFSASDAPLYNYFISKYESEHANGQKIYVVDLEKGFNNPYLGDVSNLKVTNIDNLKVKGPTLIEVKNNVVNLHAEGKDAIKEILK